jgi:hypothetical protein
LYCGALKTFVARFTENTANHQVGRASKQDRPAHAPDQAARRYWELNQLATVIDVARQVDFDQLVAEKLLDLSSDLWILVMKAVSPRVEAKLPVLDRDRISAGPGPPFKDRKGKPAL